jgi:ankyrin repeat protein
MPIENSTHEEFVTACKSGNIELVNRLIAQGAYYHIDMSSISHQEVYTALSNARYNDKYGDKFEDTMNEAIRGGDLNKVNEITLNKQRYEQQCEEYLVANYDSYEIASGTFNDKFQNKYAGFLHSAIEAGKLDIAQHFIEQFAGSEQNIVAKQLVTSSYVETIENDAIQIACKNGQLEILKYLFNTLPQNYNINNYDVDRLCTSPSPLDYAVKAGNIEIVKFLIESENLTPKLDLETALYCAVHNSQETIVKYLVEIKGQLVSDQEIIEACRNGNTEIFECLLTKYNQQHDNPNLSTKNPKLVTPTLKLSELLEDCDTSKNPKMLRYLIEKYQIKPIPPQVIAKVIKRNNIDLFKYLVEEKNIKIDQTTIGAAIEASLSSGNDLLKYLLIDRKE